MTRMRCRSDGSETEIFCWNRVPVEQLAGTNSYLVTHVTNAHNKNITREPCVSIHIAVYRFPDLTNLSRNS